jgi:hypothetical protein
MPTIKSLWIEKLRPNLHSIDNWHANGKCCKLIYAPSGVGFDGVEEMKRFCSLNPKHIFATSEGIQSINCYVNEVSGKVFDEFILIWTQQSSRMEWLLPGDSYDLPLQKYRLNFVVSAEIDVQSCQMKSVRVYWDQASLLLQSGILMRSLRSLVRPGSSDALEGVLTSLPISSDYNLLLGSQVKVQSIEKPSIGALNNIASILNELPKSTSGPAVLTPQRPTRSRSLNPALLGTLKFDNELPFDSPAPSNVRSVKSRNIFFDEGEAEKPAIKSSVKSVGLFDNITNEPSKYNPKLQLNENYIHQYESKIFSSASPTKKTCNLPQTDKILFESHVFDTKSDSNEMKHVATAPPQCPSHILSPEENLKCEREAISSTLMRPGMMGHFRGASFLAENESEPTKFVPSTTMKFDPNRSQIVLGDENDEEAFNRRQQAITRKSSYDPNRSQIVFGDL